MQRSLGLSLRLSTRRCAITYGTTFMMLPLLHGTTSAYCASSCIYCRISFRRNSLRRARDAVDIIPSPRGLVEAGVHSRSQFKHKRLEQLELPATPLPLVAVTAALLAAITMISESSQ